MKVRLVFHENKIPTRMVKMRHLPRIGERLEGGELGTFIVGDVIHTPLTGEHDAILLLLPDNSGKPN